MPWNPIVSHHGAIVSIIAVPGERGIGPEYQALIGDIVALAEGEERGGHPVPEKGPEPHLSVRGITVESRAVAPRGRRFLTWPSSPRRALHCFSVSGSASISDRLTSSDMRETSPAIRTSASSTTR